MDFYIRKNSTEPVIKMKVIEDGKNDYGNLHDKLANSSIKFSMRDVSTGIYKILNKSGSIVSVTLVDDNSPREYYIYFIDLENKTQTQREDTKENLVFILMMIVRN